MRIGVFGSGGVGGYFGGRLAIAGEDVVFIARGEHLRTMQTHGLRVESIKGDFQVKPVQASDEPAKVGPVDVVLVGVKAWQVLQAAHEMKPMIGPQTFVVPLQNGVEATDQLAEVLGRDRVLGGLCRISALIAAPGCIRHVAIEPYVAFGELDGTFSRRAEDLRQVFQRAGVMVEVPKDIRAALWEKFLFIACFGGVGAVTRAPAGVLRSLPETRHMLESAMAEVFEVALAQDISLPQDLIARTLTFFDSLSEDGMASMQRDIMEGRPSELESQNGAIVRLGAKNGISTPVNAFIYHSLLPQERRARGAISF